MLRRLYTVLEQLATGGFGVVSRVRRVTDGKILVWKELHYQRMNKKERRMMITEVGGLLHPLPMRECLASFRGIMHGILP